MHFRALAFWQSVVLIFLFDVQSSLVVSSVLFGLFVMFARLHLPVSLLTFSLLAFCLLTFAYLIQLTSVLHTSVGLTSVRWAYLRSAYLIQLTSVGLTRVQQTGAVRGCWDAVWCRAWCWVGTGLSSVQLRSEFLLHTVVLVVEFECLMNDVLSVRCEVRRSRCEEEELELLWRPRCCRCEVCSRSPMSVVCRSKRKQNCIYPVLLMTCSGHQVQRKRLLTTI